MEKQLKTHITNREIWGIALPIMLGNMAQTIINFTDTAFLGHFMLPLPEICQMGQQTHMIGGLVNLGA